MDEVNSVGVKRRWLASLAVAGVVIVLLLTVFRMPQPKTPHFNQPVARTNVAFGPRPADELALRDLEPLFLPTRYNARPRELPRREPGQTAFETDPGEHVHFDEVNPALRLPNPVKPPTSAVDAAADIPSPLASGFGTTDADLRLPSAAGVRIEVFGSTGSNGDPATLPSEHRPMLAVVLGPESRPVIGGRPVASWQPVEFAAAVENTGLAGPLLLIRGSGTEDIDNYFRNFLAARIRIGDRLPSGFYRIVVGP